MIYKLITKISFLLLLPLLYTNIASAHGGAEDEFTDETTQITVPKEGFSITDMLVIAMPVVLILGFVIFTYLNKNKTDN
jgi:hypothetical protein